MSSYSTFASVYDKLTENAQYEVRSDYISDFFSSNSVPNGANVLDLACGTGTLSQLMSKKGYNVTGVDISPEMLTIAQNKSQKSKFVCASMTQYKETEKFDAAFCSLDSINHLKDIEEVKQCFNCVFQSLKHGGIFVFDVNTLFKHKNILAENTFVFDEDDFFLVWDNESIDDSTIRILIDVFYFNGKNYDRMSEEFTEKAYDISVLKSALSDFEILGIYDEMKIEAPKEDSQRIYFVCKRK